MPRSFTLLAVFLVILGGCESRPGEDGIDTTVATRDTADVRRGDVSQTGEDADTGPSAVLGVRLQTLLESGHDREPDTQQLSVLDRLEEPNRVSVDTQANRHTRGQTDTLRTLHYDGAEITVYHVSGGKELLQHVAVTGPELESPEGVRVGMTRREVENMLGEPSEHQNGAHVYLQGEHMPTRFYVYFENDDVSRMEWLFPID